jgi:hypothetical protein
VEPNTGRHMTRPAHAIRSMLQNHGIVCVNLMAITIESSAWCEQLLPMTKVQHKSWRGLTCTNESTRAFGWGISGPYPLSSSAGQLENVQINRCCSPRRGYRSARYRDKANNRDFTIPLPISPLSEYVDYNKNVILFGHAPEPIE